MNEMFKKILPYAAAVLIFAAITMTYFNPLLEGKRMRQSDIINFKGMSKEISDYRAKTGKEALWTNSMFGGMPAYQISVQYKGNILRYADKVMQGFLPHPAGLVFLYMIGFFILLLVLGVDIWIAVAGAIAFAFSSYLFIIFEAGHNSKAHAIGYMAPVMAGIILTYRGKYLLGGLLAAAFLSLELLANHIQITYYLMMLAAIYLVVELVYCIREKRVATFAKASGVMLIVTLFALATNITSLWATWEYGKYTIRGKTELTTEKENRTSGLDKDYATDWSYGRNETFTLLIPGFAGGSSGSALSEKSESYKAMINSGIPENQARQVIKSMPTYWGPQPLTAGPIYLGAIVIFLFVFALLIADKKFRWWLAAAALLSVLLAWGKHFMPLTNFFLEYVPGYNKFRAVSMTLVIAEFAVPLLAILGLNQLMTREHNQKELLKALYISAGITAGISLFFALFGGSLFNFTTPADAQYKDYFPPALMDALLLDRSTMLKSDAFRSFAFIALAAGMMWLFINKKVNKPLFFAVVIMLVLIDMWTVNRRYVNNDNFVRKSADEHPFQPTAADEIILKDVDPNFRVYNQSVNPFMDASTSYFHKSLGGYHGAKLRRYQELIEHHLVTGNKAVFDMLNTKYIIFPNKETGQTDVQINMQALGNAWFVSDTRMVKNADEEINALSNFLPAETAVYDQRFADQVRGHNFTKDTLGKITLIKYEPNHLVYNSKASSEQLAVFSEIYYDKGWNAYIDGKKAPYFRADYVLRAMMIPAGEHTVEFIFEPVVYNTGEKISLASSIVLVLLMLGAGGFAFMNHRKKSATKA